MYSIVDRALYAPNIYVCIKPNGCGRWIRASIWYRAVQQRPCSSHLRYLLNRAENCCITRKGWRLLTPSCYINYTMNPHIDHPAPPSENEALGGVFVAVLAGFLYQRKKRHFKGLRLKAHMEIVFRGKMSNGREITVKKKSFSSTT
ncbi:hypothetical protein V6N11_005979 [Hibiscus sabdariffa]|uniref:Uncharacterized protein n=1 Tax=Hibiscus sabdariffa TaxID=183260 RepID=A0ABR2RPV5_9ROSI